MNAQSDALSTRFLTLLETHVSRLTVRGIKATGLCPFHSERTPSFTINLEKGVWHCFGCGVSGGVKRFAELVGEPWGTTRHSTRERARFAVQAQRRQAEQQSRAIRQLRADERDKALSAAYRDAYATALGCADLLTLFYQRSDLAEEFSDVVEQTERDYADALFKQTVFEAQLAGEVSS